MTEITSADDVIIMRDVADYPYQAVLYDNDGEYLYAFPDTWTDEQILYALGFANRAHAWGYARGQIAKAAEVRRAIGAEVAR